MADATDLKSVGTQVPCGFESRRPEFCLSQSISANRPTATPQAFDAARRICRKHARSFYFASFFLPKPKRNAAYAVYAFCRLLDDAVDNNPGREEAGILQFEATLDEIYNDSPPPGDDEQSLALRAFHETVHAYNIPKRYFLELAHGCRMDLTITRYETWADLEVYCYHVAGVVGLIMSCIFGPIDEPTQRQAVLMGNAMQLTNILRDVKEDFERGRIYLPQEDLARFRIDEKALANGVATEDFRNLMRFEIDRARTLYREGAEGLCKLANDGSRTTACAMAVIYAGIVGAIERQNYDVFSRRAHLTFLQKIARIPASRRLARRKSGEPIPGVF